MFIHVRIKTDVTQIQAANIFYLGSGIRDTAFYKSSQEINSLYKYKSLEELIADADRHASSTGWRASLISDSPAKENYCSAALEFNESNQLINAWKLRTNNQKPFAEIFESVQVKQLLEESVNALLKEINQKKEERQQAYNAVMPGKTYFVAKVMVKEFTGESTKVLTEQYVFCLLTNVIQEDFLLNDDAVLRLDRILPFINKERANEKINTIDEALKSGYGITGKPIWLILEFDEESLQLVNVYDRNGEVYFDKNISDYIIQSFNAASRREYKESLQIQPIQQQAVKVEAANIPFPELRNAIDQFLAKLPGEEKSQDLGAIKKAYQNNLCALYDQLVEQVRQKLFSQAKAGAIAKIAMKYIAKAEQFETNVRPQLIQQGKIEDPNLLNIAKEFESVGESLVKAADATPHLRLTAVALASIALTALLAVGIGLAVVAVFGFINPFAYLGAAALAAEIVAGVLTAAGLAGIGYGSAKLASNFNATFRSPEPEQKVHDTVKHLSFRADTFAFSS